MISSDWFTPDTYCGFMLFQVVCVLYVLCLWEGTLSAGTHAQRNSFRMVWTILVYPRLALAFKGFVLFSLLILSQLHHLLHY